MELEVNRHTKIFGVAVNHHKGFTLIELLVAFFAFSVISLVMTMTVISVIKTQRQAFALQNIQEDSRYIIETMGKEIRMSLINSDSGSGLSSINITNPDGENVDYRFTSNKLQRRVDGGVWQDLNSADKFHLNGSFYIIKGVFPVRAIVTIAMKLEYQGVKAEEQAEIYLQNTIAPRIY
jgi:prepilin-type N-terminal cleavage/methylation domain-containing protein